MYENEILPIHALPIAPDLFFWHLEPGIATKHSRFMHLAAKWWTLPVSRKIKGTNDTFEFLAIWEYFDILTLKPWFNNTSEMPLLDLSSGPKYVRHIYDYYLNGIALDFEMSVLLIYDAPPPQPQQIRDRYRKSKWKSQQ